jgi:hypothetical protein
LIGLLEVVVSTSTSVVGNGEGCRDFDRGGVENTVRGEADVSYEGVSICFIERNFA